MKQARFESTISWLQKITRVDLKYVLSGGFFLSLSQASSAIIGLGLTLAFANWMAPEAYGTYRYILATYTLLTIATLPGADTALIRSVSAGYDRSFITGVKLKMKWSLLGGAASLIYALYNFFTDQHMLGVLFIIVAIAIPFMESGTLFMSYFNAKKMYRVWAFVEIGNNLISALFLLAAMYFSNSLVVFMLAYFMPLIVMRAIMTYVIIRQIPHDSVDNSDIEKYSHSLTVFQILTRLIASIDQIILFHFLGPASVAIFSIANAIPNRIKGLFKITGTLAFPKLIQRNGAEMYSTMPRKMFLFGLFILVLCVGYIFFVPIFFTYAFPKYHNSILYSQVLVFFTLSAITYPFSSFLLAHKKINENYILAVSSFTVKVISLAIFVPLYGIWGAVIGVLMAAAVTVFLTFYYLYTGRNEKSLVSVTNQRVNG